MGNERPKAGPPIIREEITTRAVEALMSNYRDANQAILDLVDNSVDNRIENKPSNIRIRVLRDEITISNTGGLGLDFQGLANYFKWGHSEKTKAEIGQFGVGGKAAMGFLGKGMEITCSAEGSDREYHIEDADWESRSEGVLKEYLPDERKAETEDGYFKVRITGLKKQINSVALASKIGDIYRPLLLDGSVKISVNNKEVEPISIKYETGDEGLKPERLRLRTRMGDEIEVIFGILEPGQKVKPGVRCYYRGRLIEAEQFFGHPGPAQLAGTSRIIGEAFLDNVPVTSNKSNFNHSSIEWDQAFRAIHNHLTPWIEKAENLRSDDSAPIERYERDIAISAKRMIDNILADTNLITKTQLPGSAKGRLPASGESDRKNPKDTHKSPEHIEGATAPKRLSRGEVKRWGATHQVDIVSMGNDQIRSIIVDDQDSKRKILVINSDYPTYRANKKLGPEAQELYMAETIAMEICKVVAEDKTVEEYVEMLNQLVGESGRIIGNRITRKDRKRIS